MAKVIGIQFQKNGKLYYFDTNGFEPKTGDYVIVDTARGNDLGEVTIGPREIDEESWRGPLKKTVRIATEQDIQHGVENRQKEKEAFSICQKKIAEHKLEMKLVSVEYAFDNSKILFFFTANGRVDFRSLVKDLASIFKMRIELRQIGVPGSVPARIHQDGQGAEPFPEPDQNQRRLRKADVLPEIRTGTL